MTEEKKTITVAELKEKCFELFKIKRERAEITKQKTEIEAEFKAQKALILEYLEALELKNFDTGEGQIISKNIFSVKMENKELFYNFLKEENLFEDLVSVNSKTLQSFYKERLNEAIEEGNIDFSIAGISRPTIFTDITIKGVK